jgi:hypothetical protein
MQTHAKGQAYNKSHPDLSANYEKIGSLVWNKT